jgi:hypothetical protein
MSLSSDAGLAVGLQPERTVGDLTVEGYDVRRKTLWDRFVAASKNGSFMFFRDYMDYHSDRFTDHSLMIYEGEQLVGVLPGNRKDERTVSSHDGLTFGGLAVRPSASLSEILSMFVAALVHLERQGVDVLRYKRIPRFYNVLPDDEVDYALFLLDARLYRRDCAQTVCIQDRLPVRKGKKHSASRARKSGVVVAESTDFDGYWRDVLKPRLDERHSASPVHSVDEIQRLAASFPECIRLFTACFNGRMQAGVVIYETATVAHAQYSALAVNATEPGALDCLVEWLIAERYASKRYFDFGISNENAGRSLNHALLRSKEGFGARSFAHDHYEIDVHKHTRIDHTLHRAGRADG